MDPDLVRQQAEAELEHRARPQVRAKDVPAVETVLVAVAESSALPPAAIHTPLTALSMPRKPLRWRIHVQALFSGGTLAALAALAGVAWGTNHGLSTHEQAWLGGGGAALMAVIYGIALSVNGNNFTPAGSAR